MARGRMAVLGAAAALALAGCSGERDTSEGRKVEAAVKQFAAARGPEACSMLTHHALRHVYGGLSGDPRAGLRRCLALSSRFSAEPIEVTFVQFSGSREAHASAHALDRRRYYAVGLIKPHGRWLIQSVSVKSRAG